MGGHWGWAVAGAERRWGLGGRRGMRLAQGHVSLDTSSGSGLLREESQSRAGRCSASPRSVHQSSGARSQGEEAQLFLRLNASPVQVQGRRHRYNRHLAPTPRLTESLHDHVM